MNPLKVLVIGAGDAQDRLARELPEWHVEPVFATDMDSAAGQLARDDYELVVLCDATDEETLVDACAMQQAAADQPALVVVDASGELDAVEAMVRQLPAEMRPARVLTLDSAEKLAAVFRELCGTQIAIGPDADLVETLLELADANATGVLEVRAGRACTRVYFKLGQPVMVEGGSLRETLGRMLLRRGRLTEEQYSRVIDRMTASIMENEQQRMGEVLVQLELMTRDEVLDALGTQVTEKILACFQADGSEHHFLSMETLPEDLELFQVPAVPALAYRGVLQHESPERIEEVLTRYGASRPRLRDPVPEVRDRVGMDYEDQPILNRIDGSKTLVELCALPNVDGQRVARVLAALVRTHQLDFGGPIPGAARARPVASRPAPAAKATAAKIAPEPTAEGASGRRSEARARLEAEQWYRRGEALLAEERFDEARDAFSRAVGHRSEEAEYRMYEAWAVYLGAQAQACAARMGAREAAVRMVEHDSDSTGARLILGEIALEQGRVETAQREFEAALLRDPDCEPARKGVERAKDRMRS